MTREQLIQFRVWLRTELAVSAEDTQRRIIMVLRGVYVGFGEAAQDVADREFKKLLEMIDNDSSG